MTHKTSSQTAAFAEISAPPDVNKRPAFRRRRYLVDRNTQLKASLLSSLAVLLLLVFINLLWYLVSAKSAAAVLASSPELARQLASQQRTVYLLMLGASCLVLIGVAMVTILETHRTAGAAYNLAARMGEIEQGSYDVHAVLRKDDNLKNLAQAFNRMSLSLRDRTLLQAETLGSMAEEAEKITDEAGGHALATELHQLAGETRKLVE